MPFTSSETLAVRVTSEGVGGFENAMAGAANAVNKVRTAVGLAGGALAALSAGSLAAATKAAADFEQAMVEVQKVTDPETAAEMSGEIRDMAETIPLAQEKLAGLTADAARFGIRGPENIRNFTEATAKMATATNLNANQAGESLAKLSELTNTPISEVENLGSAVNSLSNNFATSSQEIVDSMLRSSAALSQFGLSQTEIAGIGAALNEVSASARRAGTRLRRVAQELMDPKKAKEVASALGMNVDEFRQMRKNSPDKLLLRMAEAMKEDGEAADALRRSLSTVSRQALAGLGQNLQGTKKALEQANTSFEEGTSLQKEFDAATGTLNTKIQLLKNRLRNSAIEIGNVLIPRLTKLVTWINNTISSGDGLLSNLSAQQKAFGLVATTVGGTIAALTALNPVLGGLAAVVTGLAVAWKTNFGNIRTTVKNVMPQIKTLIKNVLNTVKTDFKAVRRTIRKVMNKVDSVISTTLKAIKDAWSNNGSTILSESKSNFNTIYNSIKRILNLIVNSAVLPFLDEVKNVWNTHIDDVVSETLKTIKMLQLRLGVLLDKIKTQWSRHGNSIKKLIRSRFNTIKNIVSIAFDSLITTFRTSLAIIRGDWRKAWNIVKNYFDRSLGRIKDILNTKLNTYTSLFSSFFDSNTSTARSKMNEVKRIFTNVLNTIKSWVKPWISDLKELWKVHFSDILSEVKRTLNAIKNHIKTVINFIKPFIKTGLNVIKSVFKTTLGIIEGLWRAWGDTIKSIVSLFMNNIRRIIMTTLDAIATTIRTIMAIIRGDWKEAWNIVAGFAERTFERIKKAIDDALNVVETFIQDAIDNIVSIFKGLYNTLIGDSIIPNMVDEILQVFRMFKLDVSGVLDEVKGVFEDAFNSLDTILSGIVESLVGGLADKFEWLIDKAEDAYDTVRDIYNRVQGVVDDIGGAVNDAADTANNVVDDPVGTSVDVATGAASTGADLIGLQHGGIVQDQIVAQVGESGPEAVIPLDRLDDFGGPKIENVEVHANSRREGREAGREFVKELKSAGFRT